MNIIEKKTEHIFRENAVGDISVNIYKGCDQKCPFCYWPNIKDEYVVFTDADEKLADAIKTVPRHTFVKIGYGVLDRLYGLTRKCLEILITHEMEIQISAGDMILRDLDILVPYRNHIKVVMEMSRFQTMKEFNATGKSYAFMVANQVKEAGLHVCATISPILPGLTDVEKIAAAMPGIPIHISPLDIRPGTIWNELTLQYVKVYFPDLLTLYEEVARTGVDPYYEKLKQAYANDSGQIKPYLPFYDTKPDVPRV